MVILRDAVTPAMAAAFRGGAAARVVGYADGVWVDVCEGEFVFGGGRGAAGGAVERGGAAGGFGV